MSNRGVRGSKSKGSIHGGCVVIGKIRHPRQETLDLLGIVGIKPNVNDLMPIICSRLDKEERLRWERIVAEWKRKRYNSSDFMGEDDYIMSEEDLLSLHGRGSAKRLKKLNKKLFGKDKKRNNDVSHSARYIGYDAEDDYWKNRRTMFTSDEWDDSMIDDAYENPGSYKSIKFYSDVSNEFSVQEFQSLKEFSDFCDEEGIFIGDTDLENLKSWSVIHCCLDPIDLDYGEKSIITDSSYGGLYWTVSDDLPKEGDVTSSVDARTFN